MTIHADMQYNLLPEDLRGLVPIAVCELCDVELYRPEHVQGDYCTSCASDVAYFATAHYSDLTN